MPPAPFGHTEVPGTYATMEASAPQPGTGFAGDPMHEKLLGLQARLASEQKARANLQRKLQNMGEMHQALEDYKVHLGSTQKAKADAEQRLQDIKPELERQSSHYSLTQSQDH